MAKGPLTLGRQDECTGTTDHRCPWYSLRAYAVPLLVAPYRSSVPQTLSLSLSLCLSVCVSVCVAVSAITVECVGVCVE
eukprot:3260543-Rhodomonas_salina.1